MLLRRAAWTTDAGLQRPSSAVMHACPSQCPSSPRLATSMRALSAQRDQRPALKCCPRSSSCIYPDRNCRTCALLALSTCLRVRVDDVQDVSPAVQPRVARRRAHVQRRVVAGVAHGALGGTQQHGLPVQEPPPLEPLRRQRTMNSSLPYKLGQDAARHGNCG